MSFEEHDLHRLQQSLDRQMTAAEETELSDKISRDPALKAAMDDLRADHAARSPLWQSLEPTTAEADAFADRVLAKARQSPRAVPWRWWRNIAGIAACVAMGFAAGWVGRAHHAADVAGALPAASPSGYRIALTDEAGRVTAVQEFESVEQANKFAHDVAQWQELNDRARHGSPIVMSDRL